MVALAPSFCLVALGGLIRNRLSENAWLGLDRLNFDILFPALLFSSIASRPIPLPQIFTLAISVCSLLFIAMILAYLLKPLGPDRFIDFAGLWQCSWRFNTAVGLLATTSLMPAANALMPVVLGIAVPISNVLAISALSSSSNNTNFWKTIIAVLVNPFFLASFSGVLVGISGVTIPTPIMMPIKLLGNAAIPIALLSIGASMDWTALMKINRFTAFMNFIKLIAMPMIALILGFLFELTIPQLTVLIVFAALPTASAGHVLAAKFGAARRPVATLIAQSTLLSALTLPMWIYVATIIETGYFN